MIEQQLPWPTVQLAGDAMLEGITLVSKESVYMKDKQTSSEGDAWFIEYTGKTYYRCCRRRVADTLSSAIEDYFSDKQTQY